MSDYTFTCRDGDVVVIEPKAYGVLNEEEAIACGMSLAKNHQHVEVWDGGRLLQSFTDGLTT
jgi:hypothetical protein